MMNAVLREKPDAGNPHGNAIGTHVRLFFACILALPLFPANAGDSSNETWSVCVDGHPLQLERQEILTYKKGVKPYIDPVKGGWYQHGRFTLHKPVEVRVSSTRSLSGLSVAPAKYGVSPKRVSDHEVAFTAERPFHLSFEAEGRHGALLLFANEPMSAPPQSPDVIYFGPGKHVRERVDLHSGQTLFLDEGAVLCALVSAVGENISICGRGTISGACFERFKGPRGISCLWIHNATNVAVRGVAITAPNKWSVAVKECENVVFDDVRVLASNMINDDGIDIINTRNVTIRRSFIRTQDDNICTKGMCDPTAGFSPPVENVLVEDCELWCDGANVFRFGFESDAAYMRGIVVRDLDILHFSPIPNPPIEHIWSHGVFKIQTSDGVVFSRLDVQGVRIHSDGNDINLVIAEPRPLRVPRGSRNNIWSNIYRYTSGGVVRDCRFADISVTGEKGIFNGGIHLIGRSEKESVSDMTFSGITYFGEPVTRNSPCVHIGNWAEAVIAP